MITDKLLVDELSFIGVDGLDDKIIKKCLDIAIRYNIDAERFVEEWIAFAQTNLNGMLKPTAVTLDTMERKQLSKNQEKTIAKNDKHDKEELNNDSVIIYNSNGSNINDVSKILNVYNNAGTPEKSHNIKRDAATFSPSTFNPEVVKPSTVYAERKDHGQILETFGQIKDTPKQHKNPDVKITFLGEKTWASTLENTYLYETPFKTIKAANERIDHIGGIIKNKNYPNGQSIDEHLVYGRILPNSSTNSNTINFETTASAMERAQVVTVNLSNIPNFALFPGQVVLLDAKTQTTNKKTVLMAQKLFCDAMPELPKEIVPTSAGPLKLIVASGPFTLSDNLAYQPLHDLVKYVLDNPPDVLILIGPFVDKRHNSVIDGTMAESFEEYFENLLEKVTVPLQHTDIQIVVVSSALDAHYHNIFPTFPFEPLSNLDAHEKVHMVSDPAMLNINGVVIGLTSTDVLFHLAKNEFVRQPENTDRMSRFAEHVLQQRCFYPVHYSIPAAPGPHHLPLDVQLLQRHGYFDVMPHIMVLPSNLKKFIKNINGCVVINPEKLSKGYVGGTFASVTIHPDGTQQSLAENITCSIIKI